MSFQKKRKKINKYIGFSVFTQNGFKLGEVVDVYFDEFGYLKKIFVKKVFLKIKLGNLKVIDRSQIIQIKDKKIIVEDAFLKLKDKKIIYSIENV